MNKFEEYVFFMFFDVVIVERFGLRVQYKIFRNNVKFFVYVFLFLEEGNKKCFFFYGGVGGGGGNVLI